MDPMTSKIAEGLQMGLTHFLNTTELNKQCREDIETLIKFINAIPYVTTGSIGVKDYWRSMKDLLKHIELEGVNSPFYGLKSQVEKVMRYF